MPGIGPSLNSESPTAASLLASSDVWDMTLPWMPLYWDLDILARYKRSGYTFVSTTTQDWPPTFEGTQRGIEQFKELARTAADWLMFASSLADVERGKQEGKLVVGFNSQETRPIGEDLSRIENLYALGVRHMLLAYNVRNLVADGCAELADAGLSNFGRQVVREMNRVGMIVDCAHTGRRSSLEAIELSETPVIFSHANAYSVCPHIRNIRDEQIRACAARGGVIGAVGVGAFLCDREARAESMFRHIDYMTSMVGPEHVGLGTDYVSVFPVKDNLALWESEKAWPDPANAWPNPTGTQLPVGDSHCFRPEQLSELIEIMLAHGYSSQTVRGILGANFKRVYATVVLSRTDKTTPTK
jgi:membrane dipeptidase